MTEYTQDISSYQLVWLFVSHLKMQPIPRRIQYQRRAIHNPTWHWGYIFVWVF